MFEDRKPIMYVRAKEGKMHVKTGKDAENKPIIVTHDYVVGQVVAINVKEDEYKGQPTKQWQVTIRDGVDTCILTMNYATGFARGFFNSLANADLSQKVKIGCYTKGEFNCPSLIQNDQFLRWKDDNPPNPKTNSEEECLRWLENLVADLKKKLSPQTVEPTTEETSDDGEVEIDDLPF